MGRFWLHQAKRQPPTKSGAAGRLPGAGQPFRGGWRPARRRVRYPFPLPVRRLVERGFSNAGARLASQFYQAHNPTGWERHQAEVQARVRPDYQIAGGPFTSGIVNQTASLSYHRDAGNFPGNWSVMMVFAQDIDGGHLVLPELTTGGAE